MVDLIAAHNELFRRSPDECFATLPDLKTFCEQQKEASEECWHLPQKAKPLAQADNMVLQIEDETEFQLNDWSFSQLCRLAGVSRDTINRLSADTASRALRETLPSAYKPIQFLTTGSQVRSLHGVSYTRLWNANLLQVVSNVATDFQAAQQARTGGTGLYCGEQDLFCFLIDPTGWIEIDNEAFAPGFFIWNSEVGKRSLGIQTFWFQAVCGNHIVWDAVEVIEFTRKHTTRVDEGLQEIERLIENLVAKREERRDAFYTVMHKAMQEKLGADAEEVCKRLLKQGIPRGLADKAIEIAQEQGRFTIYALVDALTRLSQQTSYIGNRTEMDAKVAKLLTLVC
ncbi:MAG: hypothetical protein KDA65_16340 [Planctomycetaceae bacterium]|nr:hypothetical protein [Planctomycetaceae bacterium]